MDAKLTKMNPKTNEVANVTDAIVHNLFSPKQKATYVIEYDSSRKITKEYGSPDEMVSDWDVWNYKERDEAQKKIESDYAEYKQKHPDKYKGVL
jgi:Uma2 family endonuclease